MEGHICFWQLQKLREPNNVKCYHANGTYPTLPSMKLIPEDRGILSGALVHATSRDIGGQKSRYEVSASSRLQRRYRL